MAEDFKDYINIPFDEVVFQGNIYIRSILGFNKPIMSFKDILYDIRSQAALYIVRYNSIPTAFAITVSAWKKEINSFIPESLKSSISYGRWTSCDVKFIPIKDIPGYNKEEGLVRHCDVILLKPGDELEFFVALEYVNENNKRR